MKRYSILFAVSIFALLITACAGLNTQEMVVSQWSPTDRILRPTARIVRTDNNYQTEGRATCTALRCVKDKDEYIITILTAAHVVPVDYENNSHFLIHWFDNYNSKDYRISEAFVVAIDRGKDLALLTTRRGKPQPVIRLASLETIKQLKVFASVYLVGARLGKAPSASEGVVSSRFTGEKWFVSAPAIFGCSGGGVFLQESGEYIGMLIQIFVHRTMHSYFPLCHMAIFTPVTMIYEFLEDSGFYQEK